VHVAGHCKDDFLAEFLAVFDNAAEHWVALVATLLPPVAAEGSKGLGPESGWPVVAQYQQPTGSALFHVASQQWLGIVYAVHPLQGIREGQPPAAALEGAHANQGQPEMGQLAPSQSYLMLAQG
jgi:hypothetical protein